MSIERLRKLLSMTVANGCTEAEAMAAAEKAARLMAELGVEAGDLEYEAETIAVRAGWNSVRAGLWGVIATYTNCAVTLIGKEVEYIGREPWPEVARYLHKITNRAIDRELGAFKSTRWFKRRSSVRAKRAAAFDFTETMVLRLQVKVIELFLATYSEQSARNAVAERDRRYSTDLVTAKHVDRRGKLPRYNHARFEGLAAGDGVQLSHGVGAGATPLQIGGGA
jgi:hypothetical protein